MGYGDLTTVKYYASVNQQLTRVKEDPTYEGRDRDQLTLDCTSRARDYHDEKEYLGASQTL